MLREICLGISQAIRDAFGEGYGCLTDTAGQTPQGPCFLITLSQASVEQGLGNRFLQTQSFDIHYYPPESGGMLECADVFEKLGEALTLVTAAGGSLRGTGMRGEVKDRVLHFFVDYQAYLVRKEEQSNMEEAGIAVMERMKRDGS